ncbi:hypothetical protein PMAYCL1PPCAC_17475 [Pristionchus mayeri]|uniref:L-Fucosyltransferase n=1 Tax=Pristionchus mayeri TaxID=1317129 RepID=A0AAN5I0J4_9BILA|nr:hypothetical protein PMAYCL1PPCAC_17475 [Pristionchus mayeri]
MNRVYIFIALLFLVSLLIFFYDELFFVPATWLNGPVDYEKERFIYGALFTVDATIGGVGNNVFELMALYGIAKQIHRTPIISKQSEIHIQKDHSHFVNLLKGFKIADLPPSSKKVNLPQECCTYSDPIKAFGRYYSYETINTELWYAQSFKYFQNFTRNEILEKLRLKPELEQYAMNHQVDPAFMKGGDHTICVHSRRGDFIPSTIHAHATEEFVVPALKLLDKRVREKHGSKKPVIVMIGDDKEWMKRVIRDNLPKDFKAAIAQTNSSYPAEIDWEFSRQYCDSVLMAASGSTFGWWLAYNSRGYNVYYNSVFSKPGGFGSSLTPEDFFPPEWISLEYDVSTKQVGVRPPKT